MQMSYEEIAIFDPIVTTERQQELVYATYQNVPFSMTFNEP